jgi:Tfp pilus assembly PilM family ATPase
MTALALPSFVERLRMMDADRALGLLPPYPPVAIQLSPGELGLVRLKRQRRGQPVLEGCILRELDEAMVPPSIFQTSGVSVDELAPKLQELFDASGTRPGRVSLIIPDNLAKITLLNLPEAPASRRQLDELVRSQMRRAVPFRLEEARISYHVLPSGGRGLALLVVLVRKAVVEQYEQALQAVGAQVGLIDLCTPNLINLCRAQIAAAPPASGDIAVLNCARSYFTLAIVRKERVIFLRCKSYAVVDDADRGSKGILTREISASLSYYQDKLEGKKIDRIFVRTAELPLDDIARKLGPLGLTGVESIDPSLLLEPGEGQRPDAALLQRLAPAIGAAMGRR